VKLKTTKASAMLMHTIDPVLSTKLPGTSVLSSFNMQQMGKNLIYVPLELMKTTILMHPEYALLTGALQCQ
jgi:hypothetical protein